MKLLFLTACVLAVSSCVNNKKQNANEELAGMYKLLTIERQY
ncbi:MAG: hypothetical protein ABI683_06240 [Ginsengibacter sp.]